eukprot:m.156159 g.156159  ORF g.156159 m.156159 type:complete len:335 (-) comp14315_c0_seq2:1052-2056(-)
MPQVAIDRMNEAHRGVVATRGGTVAQSPWECYYPLPKLAAWFAIKPTSGLHMAYSRWKKRKEENRAHHHTLGTDEDREALRTEVIEAMHSKQGFSRLRADEFLCRRISQRLEDQGEQALNHHEIRYLANGEAMDRSTWRMISMLKGFTIATPRPITVERARDFTTYNCEQSLHALRTAMLSAGVLRDGVADGSRVWNMDETAAFKGTLLQPNTVMVAGEHRGSDRVAEEKQKRGTLCGVISLDGQKGPPLIISEQKGAPKLNFDPTSKSKLPLSKIGTFAYFQAKSASGSITSYILGQWLISFRQWLGHNQNVGLLFDGHATRTVRECQSLLHP